MQWARGRGWRQECRLRGGELLGTCAASACVAGGGLGGHEGGWKECRPIARAGAARSGSVGQANGPGHAVFARSTLKAAAGDTA